MSGIAERLDRIDWSKLARRLHGAVVQPGDERMLLAAKQFSAGKPLAFPRALLRCERLDDIRASLDFVVSEDIPFSVRSGGHCYGDLSSSDSVIIDLSEMNQIRIEGESVGVGPGALATDLSRDLAAAGRVIPLGGCPRVAIGGLSLAGGFGYLGRRYGLTTDQVEQMQVVTPEGKVLEVDADSEPDLFWALRGAGTAGLGIVTELVLRTSPLCEMTVCYARWPLQEAASLINRWQQWAPEASDRIILELGMTGPDFPEQAPYIELFGVVVGDQPDTTSHLREVRRSLGPQAGELQTWPASGDVAAAYLVGLLNHKMQDAWRPSRPFREIGYQFTRSDFFEEPLSLDAIRDCVANFEADRRYAQFREMEFVPWGGEYARPNPSASFIHRAPRTLIRHTVTLGAHSTQELRDHGRDWVDASQLSLRRHANGHSYQGYADLRLDNWAHAYYGESYSRLRRTKSHYDPQNVFHHARSIRPME